MVQDLQMHMLRYLEDLLEELSLTPAVQVNPTIPQPVARRVQLKFGSENEIPVMPTLDGEEGRKKEELEDLLRLYLTAPYSRS